MSDRTPENQDTPPEASKNDAVNPGRRKLAGAALGAGLGSAPGSGPGPLLAATFHGRQWALTAPHLLVAFFALPFVTLKVVGGIHYEAARLWLKGLRLQPRPRPTPGREARPDAITVPETSG